MIEKRKFVGRKSYLDDFDEFVNASSSNLDGQVLLIIGDEGMGKTALLQAMAHRAATQKHYVALGEINKYQSAFFEQIYPFIAQIQSKQKLHLGTGSDWLTAWLTGFAIAGGIVFGGVNGVLIGGATALGKLLIDIRNRHVSRGAPPIMLSELFHTELHKLDHKMAGTKRIVLFMDPKKESPPDIIPLIKEIAARGMPPGVRFIIAQRNGDEVIKAYEKGELKGICCDPMMLKLLSDDDEITFIETYDGARKLSGEVRGELISKYKGWPILLQRAIEELLKQEGAITTGDVKSLPSDIDGFWKRRYGSIQNENTLMLVQTACLLPHPYPVDRLTRFAGLQPVAMNAALHDPLLWELFETVLYADTLMLRLWDNCPYPKHVTVTDFIRGEVEKSEELKKELLRRIIKHYRETIGEDLNNAAIDKDALVFLTQFLIENLEIVDFLAEVNRLEEIKFRYGLLSSYVADHLSALEINKKLGHKEGMAKQYERMGRIHQLRGELDKALEMYGKALTIDKELGNKEEMALCYGSIGSIYRLRGELDKALKFFEKALKINKELDYKEAMASCYGRMGIVYRIREELDKALEMYGKALEIDKELDYKEGMASDYGNMGNVYVLRGELDKALKFFEKALEINKELGRKEGTAKQYGNMGNVYLARGIEMAKQSDRMDNVYQIFGELDKALEMYGKALEIDKELGNKEGMASCYGNMGSVYLNRAEPDKALEMYGKALEINKELGKKEGMASCYSNMGSVFWTRGEKERAKKVWTKSLQLFEELGVRNKIEMVRGWLENLRKGK